MADEIVRIACRSQRFSFKKEKDYHVRTDHLLNSEVFDQYIDSSF